MKPNKLMMMLEQTTKKPTKGKKKTKSMKLMNKSMKKPC